MTLLGEHFAEGANVVGKPRAIFGRGVREGSLQRFHRREKPVALQGHEDVDRVRLEMSRVLDENALE